MKTIPPYTVAPPLPCPVGLGSFLSVFPLSASLAPPLFSEEKRAEKPPSPADREVLRERRAKKRGGRPANRRRQIVNSYEQFRKPKDGKQNRRGIKNPRETVNRCGEPQTPAGNSVNRPQDGETNFLEEKTALP